MSNEEVLSLVKEQRCLVHVIKQRQANWIAHVLIHDCLLKTVLEDGRKTDTRKTKKKDVGPTHGARGQEDQLPGVEEKSEDQIEWHHHQLNLP